MKELVKPTKLEKQLIITELYGECISNNCTADGYGVICSQNYCTGNYKDCSINTCFANYGTEDDDIIF